MINWKVRFKNKTFWVTLIPAVLILAQTIASVFGYSLDFTELSGKLVAVVNAVFVVLGILGIVIDHTTEGIGDSTSALLYTAPKSSKAQVEADK